MKTGNKKGIDVIGDVHGCFDELVALLEGLGYTWRNGCYQHDEYEAVFVGDIVDRGKNIRQAMRLVKNMCEAGSARMVLGNHELNLLNISVYSNSKGDYLRAHSKHNLEQMQATYNAFVGCKDEYHELLNWLRGLPLWLEYEDVCIAHAGWSDELKNAWQRNFGANTFLTDELLAQATIKDTEIYKCVRVFTCGSTLHLPNKYTHRFTDGNYRRLIRAKFWTKEASSFGEIIFPPDCLPQHIANEELTDEDRKRIHWYDADKKPLLVGHYSLHAASFPSILASNVACVDYTCFMYGKLYAYRHTFGNKLSDDCFVCGEAETRRVADKLFNI